MKKFILFLAFSLFFLQGITFDRVFGQIAKVKFPQGRQNKLCKECANLIKTKPREILYGFSRNGDSLYFSVTRREWFNSMIKRRRDGIAVDIVSKEKYDCSSAPITSGSMHGEMQKPVYRRKLKKNIISPDGPLTIYMGKIPERFRDKDVEFNIAFIKKKYVCHYNGFYDLESYRWDLLDMGLFFDTLSYKSSFDSLGNKDKYILRNKTLEFEIPFDQNKAEYSSKDIQPLYDSLKLTDFNIDKISIRAYSSVEGSWEINEELQQKRAESIVRALQTFQTSAIVTEITTSENWSEFENDLSKTSYADLTLLDRQLIKEKLKDKKLAERLEPYLKNHRKAVVILELSKKSKYQNVEVQELVRMFSNSISERNIAKAIDIQNSLFEKIQNHNLPLNYLDSLEIPDQLDFSLLLSKNSIFKYLMSESDVYSAFKELEQLTHLIPQDGHLRYNLVALKFKIWLLGDQSIHPPDFKKEIESLGKYGIPQNLIRRMLINYEIMMSERYMSQGDFRNKDKSLKFIYSNYKYVPLADNDYLSLAQYFSSYSKYDWAIQLLRKKASEVDANQDILFYFVNLTITNNKLLEKKDYRYILLKALNSDKTRFCKLFDTYGKGGITFQLLENNHLRSIFCENCRQLEQKSKTLL